MCANDTTLLDGVRAEVQTNIDDIVREGARHMLIAALEAEVNAYIQRYAGQRDEQGRALVVRNGRSSPADGAVVNGTAVALQQMTRR